MIENRDCRYCGAEVTKNESRSYSNGSWQHLRCEPGRNPMSEPISANTEARPSALDVEEIMVDGREVTIPYDAACTLYKIAFEAVGLQEHDLVARRILGKAIHAAEACPCHTPLISQ